MAGLKLSSSVLTLGNDCELVAALASTVGISGTACAFTSSQSNANKIAKTAVKTGVLVDVSTGKYGHLPYSAETFDVVVVKDLIGSMYINERVVCLQQVLSVLREQGRCLIIERAPRGGLGALFSQRSQDQSYRATGGAINALEAEGFRAVRMLAERDGNNFIEGTK
mgnify:FL=1